MIKKSRANKRLTKSSKAMRKDINKNLSQAEKAIDRFANLGYK